MRLKALRVWGLMVVTGMLAAQVAGAAPLELVKNGMPQATVAVAAKAGPWEKRAADDLVKYVEMMSGAKLPLANAEPALGEALKGDKPVIVIGEAALAAEPSLRGALAKVAKKDPVLRADAIVLRRRGNRLYVAGTNDESHYYAVADLLRRWGCRWFMPTEFGECIPYQKDIAVDALDYAYGPWFESRAYWISWNGEQGGRPEFMRRNGMNDVGVPNGHALDQYTKELIPPGKTMFNVPIAEDATAEHVAKKVEATYAKGEHVIMGMEDGIYDSDSPRDKELKGNIFDKYFRVPTLSDPFMVFYNNVSRILEKKYPDSKSRIGFLIYSNMTLPPQREIIAEKPLVAYMAPIDVDPIHGMNDPKSPPEQEYREMMYRWAHVMQGRLCIYDYDQGMLVWRDIPNPSIHTITQNFKHYRDAGILGINTESRNAIGTTFLNLYLRGQLMWNPDADVNALNAEFYEKFFGPAAKPMGAYWDAINKAWGDSIVTEHEYFVAPAVYTPELIGQLRKYLEQGEAAVKPLQGKTNLDRNEKAYLERMKFNRVSFNIIEGYLGMVQAGASEGNYKKAVEMGQRGVDARMELAKMNPTFTTRIVPPVPETEAGGPAWFLGEVKQYRDILALTDGTKGKLITMTPLEWAFRRDPSDTGLPSGWAYKTPDMGYWKTVKNPGSIESHRNNPGQWEMLRTDLYYQAQGVFAPDGQSYTGFAWYHTPVRLSADQARGKTRIHFPGIFNECWLYVNGYMVAYRPQGAIWWLNDYKFDWDVDLTGKLKPGENTIVVRCNTLHHMGGMFRRPFLYQPVG